MVFHPISVCYSDDGVYGVGLLWAYVPAGADVKVVVFVRMSHTKLDSVLRFLFWLRGWCRIV